jgi:hypothetical protein
LSALPFEETFWTRLSELLERSERREIVLDIGTACSTIRQLAAAVAELPASDVDITGLGIVALSLFLGRPLHDDEFPRRIAQLVTGIWVTTVDGSLEPLPRPLHRWLRRAFELDGAGFESAREAWLEFERAVDESHIVLSSRASTSLIRTHRAVPLPAPVVQQIRAVVPAASGHNGEAPPLSRGLWRRALPVSAAVIAAASLVQIGALLTIGRGSRSPAAAPPAPPISSKRGQLEIRTDPPGAQVAVDGLPIGEAPLKIDLETGDHIVALGNGFDSVTQTVSVAAGRAVALAVPLAPAPVSSSSGWLMVTAPVQVQVYENGRLLGASGGQRIPIPSGQHTVEIVNGPLGYRTIRDLVIEAGKTASVTVELPTLARQP